MSTAIKYALNQVRQRIPKQILDIVFKPTTKYGLSRLQYTNVSVDSTIRNEVIEGRIRPDIDTYGVQEELISLAGLHREIVPDNTFPSFVCHVPKERTGDRVITQAIAVTLTPIGFGMGYGNMSPGLNNTRCPTPIMLQTAQAIVDSNGSAPVNQTSEVSLIGENTIYVKNMGINQQNLSLRCLLASDSEFGNLKRPSWRKFGELVVWATKAYIYNNYIIELDQNELQGGSPIGAFRNIIEGYSDADTTYMEQRDEFMGKMLIFNDDHRMDRYTQRIFGGKFM